VRNRTSAQGSGADERQLTFAHRLGGIAQRFDDVLRLQIRIGGKNFGFGHAVGDHRHDGRDRDAQTPEARHAAHLTRVDRYAGKFHGSALPAGRGAT
jgi:hypothetical protein